MNCYEDALRILTALQTQNPTDAKDAPLSRHHSRTHRDNARIAKRHRRALAEYQSSAAIRVPLATEFPNDTQMLRDAAIAYEKLANVMTAAGNLNDALENRQRSLEIFTRLAEADPKNVLAQQSLGISYHSPGRLVRRAGCAQSATTRRGHRQLRAGARNPAQNSEASDKKVGALLEGIETELKKFRR